MKNLIFFLLLIILQTSKSFTEEIKQPIKFGLDMVKSSVFNQENVISAISKQFTLDKNFNTCNVYVK